MKLLPGIAVLATVVVVGISLLVGGNTDSPHVARTAPPGPGALRALPAPHLTARQVNHQDRPDARRQDNEARAFDRRPLLSALPTTFQSVRFDIGGLAADGRTTIVRGRGRGLGRRRVQIAYDTLTRRTGDRSRSYRLEIQP